MKLEQYIEQFSAAEDPLLAELDRATNLRVVQPKMVSGRVQGAFLKLLTQILQPQTVLEIGTFTGYSALAIASGLGEGSELHTIEVEDELEEIARSFFARSPHGHKIHLHIGSALDVAPRLFRECGREPFDLVFIDGDKREYPDYYKMIMDTPMVHTGSIILVDNVLWYGKVAEESIRPGDKHTVGIQEFNALIAADERVENVILPLRDGVNLIRVK